ncbi:EAL domain-containing protein [Pleionea sp. CnH1-48]|uniref:EAL domain-containing protein n=1 Tax=Pleionea sp. CnH1-48 TaxID=2954494 RepID=UPI0020970F0F|nr:EAL domain-containing protein [Pleionea sp. CnH1-48]MCO7226465.1 EAL domain-containing protein [Pleionea sp. CnH1-48]
MIVMKSLQTKIFALFVLILIVVQAVSFWIAYQTNQQLQDLKLSNQLTTADAVFDAYYNNRSYYLAAFSETAAKDFGLKEVFEEDTRSFLAALNNHRKRIDADISVAVAPSGKVVGQLLVTKQDDGSAKVKVGKEQGQNFRYMEWLYLPDQTQLYELEGLLYQISFAPLKNGELLMGWIGFGYVIDEAVAKEFAAQTGLKTGFFIDDPTQKKWSVLSFSEAKQDVSQVNALLESIRMQQESTDILYSLHTIGEVNDKKVQLIMYNLHDDILATLEDRWLQLLIMILITVVLSLISAYVISEGITNPIKQLVSQAQYIAGGNYDIKVSIDNSAELEQLSKEFTAMQEAVLMRENKISHRLYHEPLTDLPNNNLLIQQLDEMNASEESLEYAVVLLNIRRIRDVNDTLGRAVGDDVIKEVGRRLSALGSGFSLFHIGGDEFVVVCHQTSEANLEPVIQQISERFEAIFHYQSISFHLQVQLGIAISPLHGRNAISLMQKADTALRLAKQKNAFSQLYNVQLDFNTVERLHLVNSLKTAIENEQMVLFYQPKLSLKTGRVKEVEALVRWLHPVNGLIAPDTFIHIAEQTGQMDALTQWVMNEACEQYHRWRKRGFAISIAVNVSAENLNQKGFKDKYFDLLQSKNIPVEAIILEITEDAVVNDSNKALEVLNDLREQSVRISIDDYGTGYSSLAQLKHLPVNELKIDKSFVQRLLLDDDDQIIVDSTIALAHNMGLSVVAEGVEDLSTLEWLRDKGCEKIQGYFINKPQPADEFMAWLTSSDYCPEKEV